MDVDETLSSWQANREVFLWPENWLYPELRDDQSEIFQSTLSTLLQGDLTDDAATEAYLDYLASLELIAKLEPCGIWYVPASDGSSGGGASDEIAYVVARTAGAHRKHYFRELQSGSWTPWQEVKIDCEDMPLTPIVWNGRLFLFWLRIRERTIVAARDRQDDEEHDHRSQDQGQDHNPQDGLAMDRPVGRRRR